MRGLVVAAKILTAVNDGMQARLATVECSFNRGFAGVKLIGHASEVVRDGKERGRSAVESLGYAFPCQTMVINIAPAEVRKEGSQLDLPMALAMVLAIENAQPKTFMDSWLFVGELSLTGEILPVRGVVPFALTAMASGISGVVVGSGNLPELEALSRIESAEGRCLEVAAFDHLRDVIAWCMEGRDNGLRRMQLSAATVKQSTEEKSTARAEGVSFDDMVLSSELQTIAAVACAGMHSLLLRGSPGCGKSMLASRLPSLMPKMDSKMHLECLRVHSSIYAQLPKPLLSGVPPFRSPHHQASANALLGTQDVPGELALSHGGVLFLDELTEFRRDLLESLREPLEMGEVRISRAKRKTMWQTSMLMVAACNNCPCGYFGSKIRICSCAHTKVIAYWQRLSGPVMQRIDMHINMPERHTDGSELMIELSRRGKGRSVTEQLRSQVVKAREIAYQRNRAFDGVMNGSLQGTHMLSVSGLDASDFRKLIQSVIPTGVSQRSLLRCLRVARTLADLKEKESIDSSDLELAWSWQPEPAAQVRGEEALLGKVRLQEKFG